MATILRTGFERTSRVRLPEGKTTLNVGKPIQAAITGSIVRVAQQATSMEDVGNLLTIAQQVDSTDGKPQQTKIDTVEFYHMSNGKKKTKVGNVTAMEALRKEGWKIDKVTQEDVYA